MSTDDNAKKAQKKEDKKDDKAKEEDPYFRDPQGNIIWNGIPGEQIPV